jgi:predicted MFS family arabinose efflux permease
VTEPGWPKSSVAAVLITGIIGVLIAGLQPQLLGALALEGRLSAAELGVTATAELLMMGLAAGFAGALLKPRRLRAVTTMAAAVVVVADVMTPSLSSGGIMFARIVAGLASGVLIWIAIGLIVRMAAPERWAGIYLLTQTLAQLAIATLLASLIIPAWGANGGFRFLGAISLIALLCLPWLPRAYPELPRGDTPAGLPSRAGVAALASILVYLAFVVGVWVYLEPFAAEIGLDARTAGMAVPLALGAQVLGATTATLLVGRLPSAPVLLGIGIVNLLILAVFAGGPSPVLFLGCTALFGFLWLFVMPFQVPLVIAADPTRRSAVLIAGAQLVGSSLGPLLASAVVREGDVGNTLWMGAACIIVSLSIVTALQLWRRSA